MNRTPVSMFADDDALAAVVEGRPDLGRVDRVQPPLRRSRAARRSTERASPSGSGSEWFARISLDVRARRERVDDRRAGRLDEDRVDDPVRLVADCRARRATRGPEPGFRARTRSDARRRTRRGGCGCGSRPRARRSRCRAARSRTTRGRSSRAGCATCASTGASLGVAGPPAAASDTPPSSNGQADRRQDTPEPSPSHHGGFSTVPTKIQVGTAALLGVS